MTSIHWFRRDLRITDNTALNAVVDKADKVLPVYILSDWKKSHRWTGAKRQRFLCECLDSLAGNLRAAGTNLILREGDPVKELLQLAKETGARDIYCNRDVDPHGRAVEARLAKACAAEGVELHSYKDASIFEGREVLNGQNLPFRVFTPYARAWRKCPPPKPGATVKKLAALPPNIASLEIPDLSRWGLKEEKMKILPGGEKAARERMKNFFKGPVDSYGEDRNLPAGTTTSRLSQDLRFGLLSIRELFSLCTEKAEDGSARQRLSVDTFATELIWREFYFQLLWHFPEVLEKEFSLKFCGMPWPGKADDLQKWQAGETGFPIVDAGMRELARTGFMHNRVRMITAMFLTKDLHVDWRLGEKWFMQQLVDGEIASNNGGWQWSAGTGADAAPYFRIQNPWTQTARYDPQGNYIRKWIPELQDIDPVRLAKPPEGNSRLAKNYPPPMVDHSKERDRTLERFAEWNKKQESKNG